LKILNVSETIKKVLGGKSISRFGDGEVELLIFFKRGIDTGNYSDLCWKQPYSEKLEKELIHVLTTDNKNLLVASYPVFSKQNEMLWKNNKPQSWESANKIQNYLLNIFYNNNYFPSELGNAFSFRDFLEKDSSVRKNNYLQIKNFLSNKKILLLTSRESDLKLDIFENSEVFKVNCPHNDSYSSIDELESNIISKYYEHNIDIVLMSAGPTATCLASRLSNKNIHAIDAGQIIRWHWEKP